MARKFETLILLTIPALTAFLSAFYFGYGKYFEELASGSDETDAFRWAFIGGMLISPIGLILGFLLLVLVKAILAEKRERK